MNAVPIIPRNMRIIPPTASMGPTHANGTHLIASIKQPINISEIPRVQDSQCTHHWLRLGSARKPQRIIATLRINQPMLCRSTVRP